MDVLFYNPNILPEEEFHRRLYWQRRLLETAPFGRGVELLVPPRDEAAFRAAARGLEREPEGGTRCTACFRLRLERTARQAQAGGYEYFTTTLTVSPHKNAALINAIGPGAGPGLPRPGLAPWGFQKTGRIQAERPAVPGIRPVPPELVRLRLAGGGEKMNLREKLVYPAMVGAVYAALTMMLAPISYGNVQFRVSEALCVLPFFLPETAVGLFLGCALANTISAAGVLDIVFGSLATLGAGLCTAAFGRTWRAGGGLRICPAGFSPA